jgi:predicted aspartyl protease
MKKALLIFFTTAFLFSCQKRLTPDQSTQLWDAYNKHNYFRLDKLLGNIDKQISSPEVILFKAKLDYVFNRPIESNKAINLLLEKYAVEFSDTLISDLYFMRSANYTRLEDYKSALEDGKYFIDKYAGLYDSTYVKDTKNDNLVKEVLIGVPKMKITRPDDVQIAVKRDMAGLINLPVGLGSDSVDFVFDTGANMSVIVSSLASKYGIKTLGKKVNIGAFTGNNVQADLALVNLKMGDINVANLPFIVVPDSILSFAGGAYIIRGIIGFPVMNALKEFTLKNDKLLIFPKNPHKTTTRNFALDQATPVILVKYNNDTLPFHFDTGAQSTTLYATFFNKYKDFVVKSSEKKSSVVGGAGGYKDVEVYTLGKAVFSAGNVESTLDSVSVLTQTLLSNPDHLYGNFGQDFMKKHKVMTVNFESMNISFSD